MKFPTVSSRAKWLVDNGQVLGPDSPFKGAIEVSDPLLLVVTGSNASGKSLFVRALGVLMSQKDKTLAVSISIRERTESGIRKAFMFGEEHDQSTGANSARVIRTAFKNIDRPSILILDEPEIGLSDGYAYALGQYIGEQSLTLPKECHGVVVVSHSRTLVSGLTHLGGSGKLPSHVAISADDRPEAGLDKWLTRRERNRSVEDLLELPKLGHDRWLAVKKLLKD